ncbi:hypothetical protein [Paenibacillus oceani]|uniref:Uncharacterized protein n=1 Tax=Paenibacillus oceani TaxID=2772510 RepID=A0A927GXA5_9BACL|nr:hypothetical protein [Paenibacillus oceani]MBD2860611.1 hypothetical protein [Paenibacillus oceani]
MFSFKGSLTQKNVGILNGILIGDPSVTANGGVSIASNPLTDAIDGFICSDITCKTFAQYGINAGSVSNAVFRNISIQQHGSVAQGATIGIGFVIYPKNPQRNIFIDGLYSHIHVSSTMKPIPSVAASGRRHTGQRDRDDRAPQREYSRQAGVVGERHGLCVSGHDAESDRETDMVERRGLGGWCGPAGLSRYGSNRRDEGRLSAKWMEGNIRCRIYKLRFLKAGRNG